MYTHRAQTHTDPCVNDQSAVRRPPPAQPAHHAGRRGRALRARVAAAAGHWPSAHVMCSSTTPAGGDLGPFTPGTRAQASRAPSRASGETIPGTGDPAMPKFSPSPRHGSARTLAEVCRKRARQQAEHTTAGPTPGRDQHKQQCYTHTSV